MPQVDAPLIKERATELREAGDQALSRTFTRFLSKDLQVLMETPTEGHSEHFLKVHLSSPQIPGHIVKVQGHAAAKGHLEACPV